jgi:hypothetical protein
MEDQQKRAEKKKNSTKGRGIKKHTVQKGRGIKNIQYKEAGE